MLSRRTLHRLLQAVAKPANHERLRLNQAQWQQLPVALKVPQQACAFKVPVDGEMVSMCEVNATDLRRRLNDEAKAMSEPLHLIGAG